MLEFLLVWQHKLLVTLTGGANGRTKLRWRKVKPRKHRGGGWIAGGVGHVKPCWPRIALCEQPGSSSLPALTEGGEKVGGAAEKGEGTHGWGGNARNTGGVQKCPS